MVTRERQSALTDVIRAINSSLDLNEVLRLVMDYVVSLTGAERGFLMLHDENKALITHIARNWDQKSIDPNENAISRTVIDRVIANGYPILTTNAQEDPRFGNQDSVIIFNLRSILCVPLKVKDETMGVIYADNRVRSGIFSEAERNLLQTFANHAAVAIENARLFASLRQTLSEVTELKNLMDNVFSSIASGVITADIQHKISLCNQAAQKILGRENINLTGLQLNEVLAPAIGSRTAREVFQEIEYVQKTDRHIVGKELNFSAADGESMSLILNISPLKDAQQKTQGVAIIVDDLTEQKRLEAQRRLLERMVSPKVVQQLDPDQLLLGGERSDITVLFADIRGFTRFSEQVSPEQLVSVLNRYIAAAADAILDQDGTIDKFLGDAVMAWFNAPIHQPDHALRAVKAALGIRAAVQRLQYELPAAHHLSFGAGIHYGEAILGLVGTEKRVDYTAIGDSVNTAKRIQENSTGNQILVSEAAYRLISSQVAVKPIAPLQAKGKRAPLQVYEVIGLKP